MLDINLIRENPEVVRKALADRQMSAEPVDQILTFDEQRRQLIQKVEALKAERNAVSKDIGRMKEPGERQTKIEAMRQVGDQITQLDQELAQIETQLNGVLATIPNIPDPRTPYGKSEDDNVVIKTVGEPRQFDFEPKAHWDLGPTLGIIDFERGVKITGSRFYVLSGAGHNGGNVGVYATVEQPGMLRVGDAVVIA